jgi:hypothetical protein
VGDVRDFVLVGRRVYPADVYRAAVNTAMLSHLERSLPEGCTARQAARAVSGLRTKEAHAAVMRQALALLTASGAEVPLVEAVREGRGLPIAAFPDSV